MSLTPAQRADAYNATFGVRYPASRLVADARWVQGVWVMGNNYRSRSGFYGSYPPSYLARVGALFQDVVYQEEILHVFSGSLPAGGYVRCDLQQESELRGSVYDLPTLTAGTFRLVYADPPYTKADAARYGAPMVDRRRALRAIAAVTREGGHLVWLDTVLPMFRKVDWRWWGVIGIVRSSNHRVRCAFMFERTGGG